MRTLIGLFIALVMILAVCHGISEGLTARDHRQEEHLMATKLIAEALQDLDERVRKLEAQQKSD